MPSQQTQRLITLIKSMTRSEKRVFRLIYGRNKPAADQLYIELFDFIDKSQVYNEKQLLARCTGIKKEQLSNIKTNLLEHILEALRHLHLKANTDMEIRQLLDYAKVYQLKGMTTSVLETLYKARSLAQRSNQDVLAYHVLDEERNTETQHITRSSFQKAYAIREDAVKTLETLELRDRLANLSLMLYGLYLRNGYVRSNEEYQEMLFYFNSRIPDVDPGNMGFYEKVFYYQSHVWFNHMTQNFAAYYRYSQKWVDCFHDDEKMISIDPLLYLKGLHNTLNALFMANKADKFLVNFERYIRFGESLTHRIPESHQSAYRLFFYIHQLNAIFLTGDYEQGINRISGLTEELNSSQHFWDQNREIVFYYKVACVYFGADDYDRTLDYLNKIISRPVSGLRDDIHCFARILTLICHYEMGNDLHVSHQIRAVFRFLKKMHNLQAVQRDILQFLRRTPGMNRKDMVKEFIALREKLAPYQKDPYERRPFLYLDIISWLDSKIQGRKIREVIKEKVNYGQ